MTEPVDTGGLPQEGAPDGSGRREGRGWLSSIDLLPEEADPDIAWAAEQLRERSMHQNAILAEFNARLADRGIKAISKSSWSRYTVRKAIQYRKFDLQHRISRELVSVLDPAAPDELTIAVAEMIKIAVFEIVEEGKMSTKQAQEAAAALDKSVTAQMKSAGHREKEEAKLRDRLAKAAADVAVAGRKAGVSDDALKQINDILTGAM